MEKNKEALLNAIQCIARAYMEHADFDRTLLGFVTAPPQNGLCTVQINGSEYTASVPDGCSPSVGRQVWVTAPGNNWDRLFIAAVLPPPG